MRLRPGWRLAAALAVAACGKDPEPPGLDFDQDGFVENDCNPESGLDFPGAPERCDGRDNNCDGTVDEGFSVLLFFPDVDGDGDGAPDGPVESCDQPEGHTPLDGDCDDADPEVSSLAVEMCDGVDNDCDGVRDDSSRPDGQWLIDGDGDGFGDEGVGVQRCNPGEPLVVAEGDCDDTRAGVSPAAVETCGDGTDNNCDGRIDEQAIEICGDFADNDCDGEVDEVTEEVCDGFDNDCNGVLDDPEPYELCGDGIDNDCNSLIDEPTTELCDRRDNDCDGFVDEREEEICDGLDNDCDRRIDEGCLCEGTTEVCGDFLDNDCDGLIDEPTEEVCDHFDNDCDAQVDEGCPP